jgi:putative transposase
MRMLGIQGKRKRRKFKTTWRSLEAKPAPDLVERNFVASRPDEVWVADIKYIRTREGYLYLAGVTDIFTRTVAGWAMSESLETKLVEDALEMAILRRQPKGPVIHHSDQGTRAVHQPGLRATTARGRHRPLHGQPRRCLRQRARRELPGRRWTASSSTTLCSPVEPRRGWPSSTTIESWFNPWRRHSSIGMHSPAEFERRWRVVHLPEAVTK